MKDSTTSEATKQFTFPATGRKPRKAAGQSSTHYVDICELCGRLRPVLVMTPDGPAKLCRRCAYRLGYPMGQGESYGSH